MSAIVKIVGWTDSVDVPVKSGSNTVLSARRVINVRGAIEVDQDVKNIEDPMPEGSAIAEIHY
jgi:hypothetical protein